MWFKSVGIVFFCQKRPLVGDFPASWRVDYPQLAGWTWTWYQWYQWYRLVSPQLWVWNGGFCFQMAIEIWGGWCLRYILYIYIYIWYIYMLIYIYAYIYNYIIYYNIILYYTILYYIILYYIIIYIYIHIYIYLGRPVFRHPIVSQTWNTPGYLAAFLEGSPVTWMNHDSPSSTITHHYWMLFHWVNRLTNHYSS